MKPTYVFPKYLCHSCGYFGKAKLTVGNLHGASNKNAVYVTCKNCGRKGYYWMPQKMLTKLIETLKRRDE